MIPKIIHYCWFGGNELPELARKCIDSWKAYCPDYEIIEWNENNFDVNGSLYSEQAYEAKKWAFVSDYARLKVLHDYGGIYMDTDVELVSGIDSFLEKKAFSGFEDGEHIPTGIIGAEKNSEWIRYLLSYYDNARFLNKDGSYNLTTNVTTITNMTKEKFGFTQNNTYQDIADIVSIYPKTVFCPKDLITGIVESTEDTVAIHHFNGSWLDNSAQIAIKKRMKRGKRISRIFGKTAAMYINATIDFYNNYGFIATIKKVMRKVRGINESD